jgi:hypothetical protein
MIIPSSKYPGQTAIDLTNYPQGKARNVTATGDGTGFPFEKDWINDWLGFQQAAVLAAGVSPSGSPDTALTSQLLQALAVAVAIQRPLAIYTIDPTVALGVGSNFPLTLVAQRGGFSVASGLVTVPAAGSYRVVFAGAWKSSLTTNPLTLRACVSGTSHTAWTTRFSATPADVVGAAFSAIVAIANPASDKIGVQSLLSNLQFDASVINQLSIERVS